MAALLALVFLGVGVSLIVSSNHERTETVSARVDATSVSFSHENVVEVHFADGSDGTVSANDSQSLFDAVDQFGPGDARVTRKGGSIHSVEFHGKTYDINSTDDRAIGFISLGLGLLLLAWAILSFLFSRPTADAGSAKEPA